MLGKSITTNIYFRTKTFSQLIVTLVLTTVVASLAACGGGSDDLSQVGNSGQTNPAPTPAPAPAPLAADKAYFDPIAYGNGPNDSVTDTNEDSAVTHHDVTVNGTTIRYTATAGHLIAYDASSSQPSAKMFYVAYTADGKDANTRPVTFFYNGGPGSAAVWLLLGSYAPKRIKTSMPDFTPPAPYTIETNPDSLLDKSDLVFINPVGTGYSAAIAPNKNKDFWGVDQDAVSIKQFIKRYLTANSRWNSPKFLYGESYGTPRTAVLSYKLHQDGIDLNGIVLQSSILDYKQAGNPIGLLPTYAADAWYHKKTTVTPAPADLPSYMNTLSAFAGGDFSAATKDLQAQAQALQNQESALKNNLRAAPEFTAALKDATHAQQSSWGNFASYLLTRTGTSEQTKAIAQQLLDTYASISKLPPPDDALAQTVSNYIGIPKDVLKQNGLAIDFDTFQRSLVPNLSIGGYDGRVTTSNVGIAQSISLNNNDAFDRATNGVYLAAWNVYLNQELKYTSNSVFTGITNVDWDWTHSDPTSATTKDRDSLYTINDLAGTMIANPDVKVFQASGYYDIVTPWYQTRLDLQGMAIADNLKANLQIKEYPSGHMIYLDNASRTAMKADLAAFYSSVTADKAAAKRVLNLQQRHKELQK